MAQKRRAAADIFREQNVVPQDEEMVSAAPVKQTKIAPGAPKPPSPDPSRSRKVPEPVEGLKTSEELQLEKEPIAIRETGILFWRRIIVPPNVYVVHTRAGRREPVTVGLGESFRFNPLTDAYLIVPAAMQTIGVVANCISKEKQGINILAYVQWQIDDFAVAYRKLDFSDNRDPLGIVNAQLREQAEAAIKDKISTMSVEEVLTDKAPIIEELTTRLRAVAEGRGQNGAGSDKGLGIKIVTVQIREALVSSRRLWEDLQAPFRYEKEKMARISYLTSQDEIKEKELATRQATETREAETMVEIERIKQSKETEVLDLRLTEEGTRQTKSQQAARENIGREEETTLARQESKQRVAEQSAQIEQARELGVLQRNQERAVEQARLANETKTQQQTLEIEQSLHQLTEETRLAQAQAQAEQERLERETSLKTQEAEFQQLIQEQADALQAQVLAAKLARQRDETTTALELQEAKNRVTLILKEGESDIERRYQEIRNLIGQGDLASRLIEKLPEIAAHVPDIDELKVLQTGSNEAGLDTLATFIAQVLSLAESLDMPFLSRGEQGDKSG